MRGSGSSEAQPRYGTRAATAAAEAEADAVLEREPVTFFLRLVPRQVRFPPQISLCCLRERWRRVAVRR